MSYYSFCHQTISDDNFGKKDSTSTNYMRTCYMRTCYMTTTSENHYYRTENDLNDGILRSLSYCECCRCFEMVMTLLAMTVVSIVVIGCMVVMQVAMLTCRSTCTHASPVPSCQWKLPTPQKIGITKFTKNGSTHTYTYNIYRCRMYKASCFSFF